MNSVTEGKATVTFRAVSGNMIFRNASIFQAVGGYVYLTGIDTRFTRFCAYFETVLVWKDDIIKIELGE